MAARGVLAGAGLVGLGEEGVEGVASPPPMVLSGGI
jgi:hypothetical protein